jgi:hypothetical protein
VRMPETSWPLFCRNLSAWEVWIRSSYRGSKRLKLSGSSGDTRNANLVLLDMISESGMFKVRRLKLTASEANICIQRRKDNLIQSSRISNSNDVSHHKHCLQLLAPWQEILKQSRKDGNESFPSQKQKNKHERFFHGLASKCLGTQKDAPWHLWLRLRRLSAIVVCPAS